MLRHAGAVIHYVQKGFSYEDHVLSTSSNHLLFLWRSCPATIRARPLGMEDAHHSRPALQRRGITRLLPIAPNQRGLPLVLLPERWHGRGTGNPEAHWNTAQIARSGRGSALQHRRR